MDFTVFPAHQPPCEGEQLRHVSLPQALARAPEIARKDGVSRTWKEVRSLLVLRQRRQ